MKLKIGSATIDLDKCPKELQESILEKFGAAPQTVKVKVGSAEVDLQSCPEDFKEMMREKLNLPDVVKIDFPEEFVAYAKRKIGSDEEYVRHTARFGPPLLKEWAQMILAAVGDAAPRRTQ